MADRALAASVSRADDPAVTWYDGETSDSWTWSAYRSLALQVAAGFVALGARPGDTVALMLANRREHLLADLGAMHAGAVTLTVYATLAPDQVAFIASDAGVRFAVLEGLEQLGRFTLALEQGLLSRVIVLDPAAVPAGDPRFISWSAFLALGVAADPAVVEARWRSLRPDDVVTVLYTSGTTGTPKGVPLTHRNVLYEAECVSAMMVSDEQPVNVSYLPLAHVAERVNSVYIPLHRAGSVHMCPDPVALAAVLRRARPTSFFGVPRVLEKLQSGLSALLSLEPSADRRSALAEAMSVGVAWVRAQEDGGVPSASLASSFAAADAAVLAPLRGALGLDRTRWFSSGAAPLAPAVADFFAGLGIVMCDVYGMTETTGAVTANRLDAFMVGSVGQAVPGCEVRIAADGEVMVRGPITTSGYVGRPDLTAELLSPDGWLHTGDIGVLDARGYLTIVDRKKELIITSGGENIAPALVEGALKEGALIGQAMAVGERRRHVAALLVLDAEALPGWLAAAGLPPMPLSAAVDSAPVLAAVSAAVTVANSRLARVQQVKRWTLLGREWTAESGELTPTFKLKRRVIMERYADEIEALYR